MISKEKQKIALDRLRWTLKSIGKKEFRERSLKEKKEMLTDVRGKLFWGHRGVRESLNS